MHTWKYVKWISLKFDFCFLTSIFFILESKTQTEKLQLDSTNRSSVKKDKEVAKYNSNNNLLKARAEKKKEKIKDEEEESYVFPPFNFDGA